MLVYLLIGVALGAGSGVLPGPCGLAVIRAACGGQMRRALATGLGAALGDAGYATLGLVGCGPLLARHPALPPILQACGGVALIAHGLASLRPRPPRDLPAGGGVAVGLATLVSNPGTLVTWVVVVAPLVKGAAMAQAWCAVVGIGVGSLAWSALIAHVGARLVRLAGAFSVLLVAGGALSLGRMLL